jgi:hypothetical protein
LVDIRQHSTAAGTLGTLGHQTQAHTEQKRKQESALSFLGDPFEEEKREIHV